MALIVYGGSLSPFVRKVRVVLAEKGVEATNENINPFAPPPEFLAISPLKRIPGASRHRSCRSRTRCRTPRSSAIISNTNFPTRRSIREIRSSAHARFGSRNMRTPIVAQTIGPGLFFERVVKKMMKQQPDEENCKRTLARKAATHPRLSGEGDRRQGLSRRRHVLASRTSRRHDVREFRACRRDGRSPRAGRSWPHM